MGLVKPGWLGWAGAKEHSQREILPGFEMRLGKGPSSRGEVTTAERWREQAHSWPRGLRELSDCSREAELTFVGEALARKNTWS